MSDLETELRSAMAGEVRADAYTRHLFSTDASMYSIEPLAVVFPRDAADVAAAVDVCARRRVPMLPRGAGTSLAGQTVGGRITIARGSERRPHQRAARLHAACIVPTLCDAQVIERVSLAVGQHRPQRCRSCVDGGDTADRARTLGACGGDQWAARWRGVWAPRPHAASPTTASGATRRTCLRLITGS